MRVVTSTSAAARLAAAREFIGGRPPATEQIIVAASRGAADDLARAVARDAGSTFGITRFSLTELAARAAASHPDGSRRVAGTQAGAEAIAARAVFDAVAAHELAYFAPVASMPGFPKALARAPVVFLDVPIDSCAERAFVGALVERSPAMLATVPAGDPVYRRGPIGCGGPPPIPAIVC